MLINKTHADMQYFKTISNKIVDRAYKGMITKEDALQLFSVNIFELFEFADKLRLEVKGDVVTYVVNRNIQFTNRCIGTCKFCAFKKDDGYSLSVKEIMSCVRFAKKEGSTEVCIQGGLQDDVNLDFYLEVLESIKAEFPFMHIHAFSPMEVTHAANLSGVSVKYALKSLKKAGLDTMPGTAAEILSDRVRKIICPDKLSSDEWVSVIKLAHKTGIKTTATIMYGHVETIMERIEHLEKLREIQMDTGGITEFVPLPFMPYNSEIGRMILKSGKFGTTGIEDLRIHAISRIFFNTHIDNIQASWVKLGKKLAQFALCAGANDLGGTLMKESISASAGATNGEYMSQKEFKWMIKDIGRTPIQRNTVYEII
jgi:FO synthase subunit 2